MIFLLQCGGEVLGMEEKKPEHWSVNTHTAIAILVWKLIPPCTWSGKTDDGKPYFLGFSNGYIYWQPQCLIFKNVDFKIGFFCLEHRTWEAIPKMVQAYMFGIDLWDEKEKGNIWADGVAWWPLAFSIVTMQWKCLIINWLSISEIICSFIRCLPKNEYNKDTKVSYWSFNIFFPEDVFENANWKHYFFFGLCPRLAIDMSYFSNKDEEKEETTVVF